MTMETGILLMNIDTAHFTLVNLKILANSLREVNLI